MITRQVSDLRHAQNECVQSIKTQIKAILQCCDCYTFEFGDDYLNIIVDSNFSEDVSKERLIGLSLDRDTIVLNFDNCGTWKESEVLSNQWLYILEEMESILMSTHRADYEMLVRMIKGKTIDEIRNIVCVTSEDERWLDFEFKSISASIDISNGTLCSWCSLWTPSGKCWNVVNFGLKKL